MKCTVETIETAQVRLNVPSGTDAIKVEDRALQAYLDDRTVAHVTERIVAVRP